MSIILYHGGMRSGKSDMAINQIQAYEDFGLKPILFQPRDNTRDVFNGKPIWRSLAGGIVKKYLDANWYDSKEKVLALSEKYDVFGFEEHHWYPDDFISTIFELDKMGKIVLSVGLDYFHNGVPVQTSWDLKQTKGVRVIQGVSAFCEKDLKNKKHTLAERTQLLVDGSPAFFDTPTNLVENKDKKLEYFPVSIKNWELLPPRDENQMHLYKRHYLDFKHMKC